MFWKTRSRYLIASSMRRAFSPQTTVSGAAPTKFAIMKKTTITMKALCLTWALACPSLASAAELRHFNPEIFGKGANSTVTLLLDKSGEINPSLIQLDVKDGRFYGATLRYPAE